MSGLATIEVDTVGLRLQELSAEIAHLLNTTGQRITIEPSATSPTPVVIEDISRGIMPDHLTMMSRGLKMMERGAMARDPNITGLGMVWGVEGERHEHFCGVAVRYNTGR